MGERGLVVATMDGEKWVDETREPMFRPACTVRYDDWSGCGVDVLRREVGGRTAIELTFVTDVLAPYAHTLTFDQAEQLRAALDAVTKTDSVVPHLLPQIKAEETPAAAVSVVTAA